MFNSLAKYGMELVATPTKNAKKFAKGLNQPLKGWALCHLPLRATFENLVEMALMHDGIEEDSKQAVVKSEGKSGPNAKRKRNWRNQKNGKTNGVQCRRCGYRGHLDKDCQLDESSKKCYNCDQVGHMKISCHISS